MCLLRCLTFRACVTAFDNANVATLCYTHCKSTQFYVTGHTIACIFCIYQCQLPVEFAACVDNLRQVHSQRNLLLTWLALRCSCSEGKIFHPLCSDTVHSWLVKSQLMAIICNGTAFYTFYYSKTSLVRTSRDRKQCSNYPEVWLIGVTLRKLPRTVCVIVNLFGETLSNGFLVLR